MLPFGEPAFEVHDVQPDSLVDPTTFWNLPAGQSVQEEAPFEKEYLPARQNKQPVLVAYFPGVQATQEPLREI